MPEARGRWVAFAAGAVLVTATACGGRPAAMKFVGPAMGTTYHVSVTRLPRGVGRSAVEDEIAAVLREANQHLSGWNEQGELTRINAAQTTAWQGISPVLLAALEQALAVSRATDGAFDVTVAPLVRAWGFGAGAADDPAPPSDDSIARLLGEVGYRRLELRADPPALRKDHPRLAIDLDGIAPGWAVDRITERLESLGIHDYLVELGGEVRARGLNPEGRRWRIAVETPAAGERSAYCLIELDAAAVSTSGDYRDYREVEGRRISHTIDPRTGRPVSHGLASVTVVHRSAADADAWATALMVLGAEQGRVLAQREGVAALFLERGAGPGTFVEVQTPAFARLRLPRPAQL